MDKKISELDQALQINNDAVFPISQDNGGTDTTYKVSITQISAEVGEDQTFSNLNTTDKTLVGAINEIAQGGGGGGSSTLAGLTDVDIDDQTLSDGQVLKYDSVEEKWKNDDVGAGGTTDYEDLSNKPQVNSVELVGDKSLDDLGIMPASLSKTVSGSLVHITDGADNIPVKSIVSQIVAVESGNGQPKSPTNPYTISGFDSGVVTRCGKNLIDDSKYYQAGANTVVIGQTLPNSNRTIFLPKGTYTIKVNTNVTAGIYYDFGSGSTLIGNTPDARTFTLTNDSWCAFSIYKSGGFSPSDYTSIQLEVGDTATTYHAYNGTTYTFTFGQTVYGGHFDNKGNLVVTHDIVDLGSLTWTYQNGYFYSNSISAIKTPIDSTAINGICSCCDIKSYNYVILKNQSGVIGSSSSKRLYIYIENITTSGDLLTLINGQKLVYELATPITLAITSQDIPTLLGENNIFSNCGDVTVDYYTDKADEIVEVVRHHYSTDEHIVGTWIDGSTLYEKTVEHTFTTSSQSYEIFASGIEVAFLENAMVEYSTDRWLSPDVLSKANVNNVVGVYVEKTTSNGLQITEIATTPRHWIVTIRYTKSST